MLVIINSLYMSYLIDLDNAYEPNEQTIAIHELVRPEYPHCVRPPTADTMVSWAVQAGGGRLHRLHEPGQGLLQEERPVQKAVRDAAVGSPVTEASLAVL